MAPDVVPVEGGSPCISGSESFGSRRFKKSLAINVLDKLNGNSLKHERAIMGAHDGTTVDRKSTYTVVKVVVMPLSGGLNKQGQGSLYSE